MTAPLGWPRARELLGQSHADPWLQVDGPAGADRFGADLNAALDAWHRQTDANQGPVALAWRTGPGTLLCTVLAYWPPLSRPARPPATGRATD